jgi:hypothetical protein
LFANSGLIGQELMLGKRLSVTQKDDLIVVGFATLALGQTNLVTLSGDAGATTHLTLGGSPIGVWRGTSAGTLLTSGTVTTPGTTGSGGSSGWHYIELVARLHDSTGSIEIWVDNLQVASFSGDTRNGGTDPYFDTVSFWSQNAIDDIYVLNEQGSFNNSRLGDCRVDNYGFFNGSNNNWVGSDGDSVNNAALLQQTNYGNSFSTWVTANADNQFDSYNTADISIGANESIRGVEVWAFGAKADSGARTLALTAQTGAGTSQSADLTLLAGAARRISNLFEMDPVGSPWSVANYNGAEFGLKARP